MNFYPHHIKDFNNSTRHLTRVERSVYRDAIELYYDTESVLFYDIDKLSRRLLCVSEEEKIALKTVLSEFFIKTDSGYFHERCEDEIKRINDLSKNHWATKLTKAQRSAIQADRNAAKKNATPKWSEKELISGLYAECAIITAQTGIKHEVDHIYPLRGKTVSGLHVLVNLRIITAVENRRKSNLEGVL